MKKLLITLFASTTLLAQAQDKPVYLDTKASLENRVEDALSRMTLREKINMIHAQSKFSSPGVPRLGIPEVWCTDGPHGIRPEVLWDEWEQAGWTNDSCVAYPALTCLSATWDPEMSRLYGVSIGEEARYRNKNVLLGPGVNIYRTPLNGRNFEYMGEDPYLSGKMVVPYIQGVQANGVAVCVKHYALNNNEENRNNSNPIVDERTLREIYLPAFKAAVQEGGAWSLMCSYNLYKGMWLSENDYLLNQILKKEWGFDGVVISDWGAVHNTLGTVKGGLDLEYGSWTNGLDGGMKNAYDAYFLAMPYMNLITSGKLGTDELNDKCRRILRMIFRTTMSGERPFGALNSEAHVAAARQIGAQGIVLLKNDAPAKGAEALLPINTQKVKRILVVGENAVKMQTVGGGSSSLKVQHEVSPLDGIKARFQGVQVDYQRGYVGDASGQYNGVVTGQDLSESRSKEQLIADAIKAAREADMVIFIGGLNKSNNQDCEGADRTQLELPYDQDDVITALAAVNKNMVVINISGNAVCMPWLAKVPAVLQDWYLGSEAGNSLADVLSGDVNPSGHLPFTYYASLDQCGAHALGEYPGHVNEELTAACKARTGLDMPIYDIEYKEGIFVGYRYIDKNKLKPTFPFGHGLSYTTFQIDKASAAKVMDKNGDITITVPVKNTGSREGAEVVQLYVQQVKSSLPRPIKELKAFSKVNLKPGESKQLLFTLNSEALSYYNDQLGKWVCEPGQYIVHIGTSAGDIRTSVKFEVK